MKCERCKKNAATVHYTEISKVNGKSQRMETHLCEECARQTGAVKPAAMTIPAITGLVQAVAGASVVERIPREHAELKCPDCGLGYPEFRAKTRFGCARDYEIFAPALEPLFTKIHGSARHAGKTPRGAGEVARREGELGRLREEMEREIRAERYERAAELRDRIKKLETGEEPRA